jgi:flagellar FliJ protein
MKSRDTLIRLKRFQVDEKRRRVAQIETMIAEFDRMAAELDREIAAEEQKAGISDPAHFAYPTYARAAAQRRDNLRQSAQNLYGQLDDAKAELGEAFEELKKVEILDDRERSAERAQENARDQAAMNQIGLQRTIRATA